MKEKIFECGGKKACLYRSEQANAPLIVLNSYAEEGASVLQALRKIDAPECSLLVVSNLEWNHDLTPWSCPPIAQRDEPCTGGAEDYLHLLLSQILPQARALLPGTPRFVGIAGYSLAGLFALYALYRCDVFDRAASISGSLWFPQFRDYVLSNEPKKAPEKLYFSLGDREARTRNPYLRPVQENTEQIVSHFKQLGLDVSWELNLGNHFKDAALRSAKGIRALLE